MCLQDGRSVSAACLFTSSTLVANAFWAFTVSNVASFSYTCVRSCSNYYWRILFACGGRRLSLRCVNFHWVRTFHRTARRTSAFIIVAEECSCTRGKTLCLGRRRFRTAFRLSLYSDQSDILEMKINKVRVFQKSHVRLLLWRRTTRPIFWSPDENRWRHRGSCCHDT